MKRVCKAITLRLMIKMRARLNDTVAATYDITNNLQH